MANPVVDTTQFGVFVIHVREHDVRAAEALQMQPRQLAVARQPIGHGFVAFDLCHGDQCTECRKDTDMAPPDGNGEGGMPSEPPDNDPGDFPLDPGNGETE